MATSHSVSYRAPADQVWAAVVRLVTAAGYPVARTDQAAKQIIYQASGGGFALAQNVQISVTGVEDDETMVSILVQAAGQQTLTEGGQQRKLISFVVDELSQKRVQLGPGTLYGALSNLQTLGLIEAVGESGSERRKLYCMTESGRLIAEHEVKRFEELARHGRLLMGM